MNMSSHERCWKTPIKQMTPMIPNEMIESFCASSSILRCNGVRRSSTSCIMLNITPNSVCEPVATTIPEPRPGERELDYHLSVSWDLKERAVSHQRAHVGYARPLSHLSAFGTRGNTFPVRCGLTRQTTLVDIEVNSSNQAYIRRYAVASGEDDEVARDDLIREEVYLFSITNDVAVMRDELVKRFERFF